MVEPFEPVLIILLAITLSLSVAVSYTAARVFRKPIGAIFTRIIQDEISAAWQRYVMFATYVVGISAGVRIYYLEILSVTSAPSSKTWKFCS